MRVKRIGITANALLDEVIFVNRSGKAGVSLYAKHEGYTYLIAELDMKKIREGSAMRY